MIPLLIVLTALGFGAGDFLAGLASKKVSALTVSLYSQGVAIGLAALAVFFFGGAPDPAAVGWGLAAGIAVGLGIVRYYHGLTHGAMGWVATVMGAFSALVPLGVGIVLGERPSALAIGGVFIIVAALFLVIRRNGTSRKDGRCSVPACGRRATTFGSARVVRRFTQHIPGPTVRNTRTPMSWLKRRAATIWYRFHRVGETAEEGRAHPTGIGDGVVAGTCFGFSFVFVGLASVDGPFWPVLMALAGSIPPILVFRLRKVGLAGDRKGVWPLIVAVGVCQGLAFIAFAVAVADGYISIVSVAGALSPVATSLLAFLVLCERMTGRQMMAVGIAIAGIICLVLGV